MRKNNRITGNCPCNSGKNYKECCKPYHKGKDPKTALILMRARYSAYIKGRDSFIEDTWHPSTRPENIDFDSDIKWTSLEIQDTKLGTESDDTGFVTFYIRFIKDGFPGAMTEISEFIKESDRWYYLKGIIK